MESRLVRGQRLSRRARHTTPSSPRLSQLRTWTVQMMNGDVAGGTVVVP